MELVAGLNVKRTQQTTVPTQPWVGASVAGPEVGLPVGPKEGADVEGDREGDEVGTEVTGSGQFCTTVRLSAKNKPAAGEPSLLLHGTVKQDSVAAKLKLAVL